MDLPKGNLPKPDHARSLLMLALSQNANITEIEKMVDTLIESIRHDGMLDRHELECSIIENIQYTFKFIATRNNDPAEEEA